jgi:uncharacterized integral membrane protein
MVRTDAPTAGTGVTRYVVAALVVAVLAVVLAVRNSERVEVDLLVWSGRAPLYAVAIIAALLGAAFTALVTAVWRHRRIALNRERRSAVDLRGRGRERSGEPSRQS